MTSIFKTALSFSIALAATLSFVAAPAALAKNHKGGPAMMKECKQFCPDAKDMHSVHECIESKEKDAEFQKSKCYKMHEAHEKHEGKEKEAHDHDMKEVQDHKADHSGEKSDINEPAKAPDKK